MEKKFLHNVPKSPWCINAVTTEDGPTVPIFGADQIRPYCFRLYKLVEDWREPSCVTYSPIGLSGGPTSVELFDQFEMFYSTDGILFIAGSVDEPEVVVINTKVLSLRDIAFRKVVNCWKNSNVSSFQKFIEVLNLPTFMKPQYLGPPCCKTM